VIILFCRRFLLPLEPRCSTALELVVQEGAALPSLDDEEHQATILSERFWDCSSIIVASLLCTSLTALLLSNLILQRMEAVFAWCKGAKFIEVQKLTGTFEGTTIRTLRRLEELVRQISAAAKAIGNQELESKFEKADGLLKRDIVFCSSLYL
jgi:superfamily II RNA helicase